MATIGEHLIESCKQWERTLREDVAAYKAALGAERVPNDAKKHLAAGLNYLVTRLDLVPDFEPTIGVLDDVMVLRVCAALASDAGLDDGIDETSQLRLARMANEAEVIEQHMGEEIYPHFRKRCEHLAEEPVRGRTPERIVTDRASLAQLLQEVEDELNRLPAASFSDPAALARQLNAYLKTKLGLAQ